MISTVAKLLPILLAMLIAPVAYWTGEQLSIWGARIHPVEGWREWYTSLGRKGILREESCPDTVGAIHLSGIASTNDLWNASFGRSLKEIVPRTMYQCRCRIRGNGRNSVCLILFDPSNQQNLLEQFFTPPTEWHDYQFVFESGESKELSIILLVGAKSISIDLARIEISPYVAEPPTVSNECTDQVIHNDSWSMHPMVYDGSTLLPGSGDDSANDITLQSTKGGIPPKSIATKIFGATGQSELTLQFEASSHPPTEVICWLSDGNGHDSAKQRIQLSENIEMKRCMAPFLIPAPNVRLFIQPENRCELCLHSASISACPAPDLPEGYIDARLIKLVADKGVRATVKLSPNPEGPIELVTESETVHSTRFDVPIKVEGNKSARILLKARADRPINLRLVVAENHEPWDAISKEMEFEVSTEWKELVLPFKSKVTDSNARLVFLWNDSKGSVEVSDIRLLTEDGGTEEQGSPK